MSEVSPRGTLSATGVEVTDRGLVREENQDNVRKASLPIGELFIVADGIGGYQGGAIASQMVVDGFHSQLAIKAANYPPQAALQEACDYTNSSIHQKATSGDPATQRMGSTVVMALLQTNSASPMAWVGHVGDSRAYLIRGGRMSKITSDHSAVQALLSRNLITEEEAHNHPDASVLTRSLGHRPDVEIEIDPVPLQAGDAIMLCSDGLWGYVAESDIAAVVTNSTLAMDTVKDLLLQLALDAGGQDNIGIEYVRISGNAAGVSAPLSAAFPANASAAVSHAEAKKAHSARKLQMAAIGLLLLGGIGIAGIVYKDKLFHSYPLKAIKVALIGEPRTKSPVPHLNPNGKTTWTLYPFSKEDKGQCAELAAKATRMFADNPSIDKQSLLNEISQADIDGTQHVILNDGSAFESITADVQKECGPEFNVVIILHKDRPQVSTDSQPNNPNPTTPHVGKNPGAPQPQNGNGKDKANTGGSGKSVEDHPVHDHPPAVNPQPPSTPDSNPHTN